MFHGDLSEKKNINVNNPLWTNIRYSHPWMNVYLYSKLVKQKEGEPLLPISLTSLTFRKFIG